MKFTKNQAIIILLLLVMLICVVGYSALRTTKVPPIFACTMDALICPDGSGVGRSGPSCTFSACPSKGEISGIYAVREGKSYLDDVRQDASYAIPLLMSSEVIPADMIGKLVTITGAYTEGNIFSVVGIKAQMSSTTEILPTTTTTHNEGISLSETVVIHDVSITLNKVIADSRCPHDVQCIQAGSITANITLKHGMDKETVDLTSSAPYTFSGRQISIVDATPFRMSGEIFKDREYKIVFAVTTL